MPRNLPFDRNKRLADLVHRVVAEELLTGLSDPRLAGVRISRVTVTRDLKLARINFRLEEDSEKARREALKGLLSARGFFKRGIGEAVELKFMPQLEFFYDEASESGEHVERLLRELHR